MGQINKKPLPGKIAYKLTDIKWKDAPNRSYIYHAFDSVGVGYWYKSYPVRTATGFTVSAGHAVASRYSAASTLTPWKTSVTWRPSIKFTNKVDWTKAPSWAKGHIYSKFGIGYWCSLESFQYSKDKWKIWDSNEESGFIMNPNLDWKLSFEKRPQVPHVSSTYEVDWTEAPALANYHVFDSEGEGHWLKDMPVIGDAGWLVSTVTQASKYTLPSDLDWRKSLACRPKQKPTLSYEVDWSKAPSWGNYHGFDSDGKGYWFEQKPEIVKDDWRYYSFSLNSNFRLPDGLDWKESITDRPKQKSVKSYEVDWTNAPEWASCHAFNESGIGYWIENKNVRSGVSAWMPSAKWTYSGFALPSGLDWSQSKTTRPEPIQTEQPKPEPTIDERIEAARNELKRLEELKERETPIEISVINGSRLGNIFIGFGLAPDHLIGRCLMFETAKLELRTQIHNEFTVLTFHKL